MRSTGAEGSRTLPHPKALPSPCHQSKSVRGRRGKWQGRWVLSSALQGQPNQHLPAKTVGNYSTGASVPPIALSWDVQQQHPDSPPQ